MPSPGTHQWLYLHNGDYLQEVVNGARTATYLQNIGIDGISICSVLDMAGCPAYAYIPCEEDSSGSPLPTLYDCDASVEIEFDTPATDPAPWYDANYAPSADALGFYIEEWTGLDSGHISRPTSPSGRQGGGVSFGAAGSPGRVQKINILLLARTEEAMMYLFDWLDATLIGACSGCATDSLLYRRICFPTVPYPAQYQKIGEQRRVVLTEGLKWEANIEGRGDCQIRRASFTITAGDPCVYGTGNTVSGTTYDANLPYCIDNTVWDPGRSACRPSCSEVDVQCLQVRTVEPGNYQGGWMWAPVIRLDNDFDTHSLPARLIIREWMDGAHPQTDRCGLPLLAEIYIQPLPPWSRLTWDVIGRRVLYRDVSTGVDVESFAFIEANDPPIQRWFVSNCYSPLLITIEPADFCMEEDSGDLIWERGGLTFTDPHYPEIDVHVNQRYHCT